MEKIVLPSGNVVPALCEQDLYLELRFGLMFKHSRWPRNNYGTRIRRRKLKKWNVSTSGESTFVQHGIEPKEISQKELNRRAWREHKQFVRDKKRNGSIMDGCPPWLKRQCNKEYRRWVKDCIKKGQYEKIGSRSRKDFFDPWMWS